MRFVFDDNVLFVYHRLSSYLALFGGQFFVCSALILMKMAKLPEADDKIKLIKLCIIFLPHLVYYNIRRLTISHSLVELKKWNASFFLRISVFFFFFVLNWNEKEVNDFIIWLFSWFCQGKIISYHCHAKSLMAIRL